MKKVKNEEVQNFLNDIKAMDTEKYNAMIEMREIIFDTFPKTVEKMMYGGIVFFLNDEMFGGLFAYKNHLTFEFSKGFLMEDLNNFLEGKGKYRRHLKILSKDDILGKEVKSFVEQAV